MELAEIVMNPVRQRIFQYLLLHETGTVKEIRKALPDVPGASLYRHMKLLTESGILTVVGENRIRGTVESIYSLNKSALEIDDERHGGADGAAGPQRLLCQIFFRRRGRPQAGYAADDHLHPDPDG